MTTFNRYPRPLPIKAVQIPTDTMEQEFATHYRRGFEARGKQLDVEIEALKRELEEQRRKTHTAIAAATHAWEIVEMLATFDGRNRIVHLRGLAQQTLRRRDNAAS